MNQTRKFLNDMTKAAKGGHVEIVKLYKEWGATYFDEVMSYAAKGGHVEIVKLCKEWGATDFDEAMSNAAWEGHVEIVKLCKEWGATDFNRAMSVSYTHLRAHETRGNLVCRLLLEKKK